MTENKQFKIEFDGHRYFIVIDTVNERCLARLDTRLDASAWLEIYEMLSDENEQLKQQLQQEEQSEMLRKEYNEFWEEKIQKGLEND